MEEMVLMPAFYKNMTRTVKLGNLKIGSKYPVRIKGMLKTPYSDIRGLIAEAKHLEKEGAEALRVAVREERDAKIAKTLKEEIGVPLVADIHFHYKVALAAIENGFDGIRLNPLNISKTTEIREVVRQAKACKIPIRVGVNSGGFKKNFSSPEALARQMVSSCGRYIRILEKESFFDIMVSLKGSDAATTIIANELFSKEFNYPLHLGITATGSYLAGVVKSSIGLGGLLSKGIGNIIRVSLTAPSFLEIRVAKYILQALNLRKYGPEIVSCPTCSRCEVKLIDIVDRFNKELIDSGLTAPIRIALMGCVVNGPGEARQADIGAAFGKKKAVIFKKDKILRNSDENNIIKDLLQEVRKTWM
ncbi:MAG: flavodoxin-dependent (E)-4-hydroxy-3-methylbut-2-enyl-diphosphate synthase [Candidatus Omnitrophica bacterium]|nr:flavodoxin-dependent (E)-4-hydroxy-3-methylbut-2-enyl-diphosphate synthase [Candidatus Omnitrophota bacterium]